MLSFEELSKVYRSAYKLYFKKQYEQSLEQYLYMYKESSLERHYLRVVCFSGWAELAQAYEPAKNKLLSIQKKCVDGIYNSQKPSLEDIRDAIFISDKLKDFHTISRLFEFLVFLSPELAQEIWNDDVRHALIENNSFPLAIKYTKSANVECKELYASYMELMKIKNGDYKEVFLKYLQDLSTLYRHMNDHKSVKIVDSFSTKLKFHSVQ